MRLSHSSGCTPTITALEWVDQITGRLIRLGNSSKTSQALDSSLTLACTAFGRERQVVLFLLTKVSQSTRVHHPLSWDKVGGDFLKSWNSYSMPFESSQTRAFLTLSQLGIPNSFTLGCIFDWFIQGILLDGAWIAAKKSLQSINCRSISKSELRRQSLAQFYQKLTTVKDTSIRWT